MVKPLEPPDSHHLAAAEGWLELGNPEEAAAELARVASEQARHPAVLDLDWQIHARLREWEICLELASRLVQLAPELPSGWIHRSYALHELKRTIEARDQLLPAVAQFPEEAILTYNLACYECRLGNLGPARQWLKRTFAINQGIPARQAAQKDPDLQALWPEIETL